MANRMQQRRGTAARWIEINPVLALGEIGFEIDTGKFKIGTGSTTWTSLGYYSPDQDLFIGQPNGIATLDSNGDIPSSQLGNVPPGTTMSDTAPSNPQSGARWFKTSTAQEFIYYNSAWIEI